MTIALENHRDRMNPTIEYLGWDFESEVAHSIYATAALVT
jgi:hypothetical protein